jgi:hypothetical protein
METRPVLFLANKNWRTLNISRNKQSSTARVRDGVVALQALQILFAGHASEM